MLDCLCVECILPSTPVYMPTHLGIGTTDTCPKWQTFVHEKVVLSSGWMLCFDDQKFSKFDQNWQNPESIGTITLSKIYL